MTPKPILIAAVLVTLPVAAVAQESADAGYEAAIDKMTPHMMKPISGDADKDFVTLMIPHHQGAIDMAKVELQFGKDTRLRAMADKIIKAQEKEIAEMKRWQAAHP